MSSSTRYEINENVNNVNQLFQSNCMSSIANAMIGLKKLPKEGEILFSYFVNRKFNRRFQLGDVTIDGRSYSNFLIYSFPPPPSQKKRC